MAKPLFTRQYQVVTALMVLYLCLLWFDLYVDNRAVGDRATAHHPRRLCPARFPSAQL